MKSLIVQNWMNGAARTDGRRCIRQTELWIYIPSKGWTKFDKHTFLIKLSKYLKFCRKLQSQQLKPIAAPLWLENLLKSNLICFNFRLCSIFLEVEIAFWLCLPTYACNNKSFFELELKQKQGGINQPLVVGRGKPCFRLELPRDCFVRESF